MRFQCVELFLMHEADVHMLSCFFFNHMDVDMHGDVSPAHSWNEILSSFIMKICHLLNARKNGRQRVCLCLAQILIVSTCSLD